ncbi:sperm-associated antigen 1 [Phoenix dactylifera]|uniref:Sperm-associated antigen 1 n=1 Tax=Phoenix dactylifera TaxID=42345 RepID=A0A8B7CV44_PHODC|nr:sperm-associated antigen 1 [Phoenix dactylifera]
MAAVLDKIERAHQMYREGQHEEALGLYTEALALAKTKAQKIALHSNRAACYLKLHDFKKAAEECTSVLELDHQHTGALMLRAQTLVTLKDYQSALFDVNRLMELNPSSDVYQNLQARLRTQLSLAPIPESEEEALCLEEDEEFPPKRDTKIELPSSNPGVPITQTPNLEVSANLPSKPKGWEAIPKPKGHSGLDYSRWDRVEDDSSEEEEDDAEEQQPQYRFRVRTVGIRPVK